jgi:hypothetical protein
MLTKTIAVIPIVLLPSKWFAALIGSRRDFKSVAANAVENDGADFATGRFELPTAWGMAWGFRKVIAGGRSLKDSGRAAVNRVERVSSLMMPHSISRAAWSTKSEVIVCCRSDHASDNTLKQ